MAPHLDHLDLDSKVLPKIAPGIVQKDGNNSTIQ
jgi:hypothetical protein